MDSMYVCRVRYRNQGSQTFLRTHFVFHSQALNSPAKIRIILREFCHANSLEGCGLYHVSLPRVITVLASKTKWPPPVGKKPVLSGSWQKGKGHWLGREVRHSIARIVTTKVHMVKAVKFLLHVINTSFLNIYVFGQRVCTQGTVSFICRSKIMLYITPRGTTNN